MSKSAWYSNAFCPLHLSLLLGAYYRAIEKLVTLTNISTRTFVSFKTCPFFSFSFSFVFPTVYSISICPLVPESLNESTNLPKHCFPRAADCKGTIFYYGGLKLLESSMLAYTSKKIRPMSSNRQWTSGHCIFTRKSKSSHQRRALRSLRTVAD
jgi:hypothetical protein